MQEGFRNQQLTIGRPTRKRVYFPKTQPLPKIGQKIILFQDLQAENKKTKNGKENQQTNKPHEPGAPLGSAEAEEMQRAEGAAKQAFRKLVGAIEAEKRSVPWEKRNGNGRCYKGF